MQQLQARKSPARRHQLKRLQLRRNQLERVRHQQRQHRIVQLRQQRAQLLGRLARNTIDILRSGLRWQLQWEGGTRPASTGAARRRMITRTRVSGVVASVLPGEQVADLQLMAADASAASHWLAELWVDQRSLDFMRKGATVVIRYRAFSHQRYGRYRGRVLSRSPLAISADRATQLLGRPTDGPRFRVRVWLDQQNAIVDGRTEPLIPGMTLDADILFERQPPADADGLLRSLG